MAGDGRDVLIVGGGIDGLTMALAPHQAVLANRRNPPDAILREVYQRTGDMPFDRIESVIAPEELRALSEGYQRIAGLRRPA